MVREVRDITELDVYDGWKILKTSGTLQNVDDILSVALRWTAWVDISCSNDQT